MSGLTVYQIYDRARYYCSTPITVSVTETEQDRDVMPAMVICPPGQFRASLAAFRAYGDTGDGGSVNSDLFNFEQYRQTYMTKFQNISVSDALKSADIDSLFQNLSINSKDLLQVPDIPMFFERLDKISNSWENILPMMAYALKAENIMAIANKTIPLQTSDFDNIISFENYREFNGLFDSCAKSALAWNLDNPKPTWDMIAAILQCRIGIPGGPNFRWSSTQILEDLTRFSSYPRLVNLARPNLTDVVLDCKWFNSQVSSSENDCNVTAVWTPFGQCFRVAQTDAPMSTPKNDAFISILIDTLFTEFPNGKTKVYFYSQNETEFAASTGGTFIAPGLMSRIEINEMRQNIRADKNCGSTPLKYFKSYSQAKCIWEKETDPVAKECSCLYDRAPNYFNDTMEDVAKMRNETSEFFNSSLNYCSIFDILYCIPKALANSSDCPANCEELSPDVSLVTNLLDPRKTFTRLPQDFDSKINENLGYLSKYGGYLKVPGSDQLTILLSELFHKHLQMIVTFWWRNRTESEPFYMPWYDFNNVYSLPLNSMDKYFDSKTPLLPFEFNGSVFEKSEENLPYFIEIIESIVAKYYKFQGEWKTNYTTEVFEPFYTEIKEDLAFAKNATDELASMRLFVLNTFVADFNYLVECVTIPIIPTVEGCINFNYGCQIVEPEVSLKKRRECLSKIEELALGDPSLAYTWRLKSIWSLERLIQLYNSSDFITPVGILKNLIDSVSAINNNTGNSLWTAPWSIYLDWFLKEIRPINKRDRTTTLAEALSHTANSSDVFLITNMYLAGSTKREELRQIMIEVTVALNNLIVPLQSIHDVALEIIGNKDQKMLSVYEAFFVYMSYDNRETIQQYLNALYQEPAQQEYLLMLIDNNTTMYGINAINAILGGNSFAGRVFQLINEGTSTTWFDSFTYLIDNILDVYQNGSSYQKTSLAEINLSFRTFRLRMIEEQEDYGIWSLLSDIGGALGLWLGGTVIGLYELIVIILPNKRLFKQQIEDKQRPEEKKQTEEKPSMKKGRNTGPPPNIYDPKNYI